MRRINRCAGKNLINFRFVAYFGGKYDFEPFDKSCMLTEKLTCIKGCATMVHDLKRIPIAHIALLVQHAKQICAKKTTNLLFSLNV